VYVCAATSPPLVGVHDPVAAAAAAGDGRGGGGLMENGM